MEELEEETRERVTKSSLNRSTSKQLWTFSKKDRFQKIKTECPYAYYNIPLSTINNKQVRLMFSEQANPSPTHYHPQKEQKNRGPSFGSSREKCTFNEYLPSSQSKKPGPSDYQNSPAPKAGRGFTMRPKTAHQRTYFIDNKEKGEMPGPANYDARIENAGKLKLSKFRTIHNGATGLMFRSQRFLNAHESPGPANYDPKKISLRNNSQGTMAKTARCSWIEKETARGGREPGPGDYNLPSQFGHYLKPRSKRLMTIS